MKRVSETAVIPISEWRHNKTGKRLPAKQKMDPQGNVDEKTVSDLEDEKIASKDIPFLYRKFANRYSFINVHMALMFGLLTIENGVPR